MDEIKAWWEREGFVIEVIPLTMILLGLLMAGVGLIFLCRG